jgi:hypothetical protein
MCRASRFEFLGRIVLHFKNWGDARDPGPLNVIGKIHHARETQQDAYRNKRRRQRGRQLAVLRSRGHFITVPRDDIQILANESDKFRSSFKLRHRSRSGGVSHGRGDGGGSHAINKNAVGRFRKDWHQRSESWLSQPQQSPQSGTMFADMMR